MSGEAGPERIQRRKDDHLTVAARDDIEHLQRGGFERFRIRHRALPGRDLAEVDLAVDCLGHRLAAPLIISSMTGGTERARQVNARLSLAAEASGLAMGLGSGRAALEHPDLVDTFRLPARPPLLFANLGAVQLRRGLGPDDAERLVDVLEADALFLHLNTIQEAVQPGGDTEFGRLLDPIQAVVERVAPRPVAVKEVGFGLGPEDVRDLLSTGVAALDVSGAGGTNWALIEGQRDEAAGQVAAAFANWGWPTAIALQEAVALAGPLGVPVFASGGIRDGVDAAIALALGAALAGLARPMLLGALEDRAVEVAMVLVRQLRIAVWGAGVARVTDLGPANLLSDGELRPTLHE
jgi:isopentenyl-diphosphate delta-isomerase